MAIVTTFLHFDGQCREAMTFYAKCMGAELQLMPYSATPCDAPGELQERVAHASLLKGGVLLSASDRLAGAPGPPYQPGNNFMICLECESLAEIEGLFAALSENGTVVMALHDTFWGARYGMLTDQFGIQWMFNHTLPKG